MAKRFFTLIYLALAIALSGCDNGDKKDTIIFATCADYPPFEFYQNNELKGFDIELAQLIARELKKEARIEDMEFNAILASLQNGSVDAAISTITITEERKNNFDFSDSYYEDSVAIVYKKPAPLSNVIHMANKKIACQLGTTMEIWLKKYALNADIVLMNHSIQAIEALKAGHVDGVVVDKMQAIAFSNKNPDLSYDLLAKADTGYGIAVKKGSKLKDEINKALEALQQNGELDALKIKYLENTEWTQ